MVLKCQEKNHEKIVTVRIQNWLLVSNEQDISQDIYFYFSATFEITENIS